MSLSSAPRGDPERVPKQSLNTLLVFSAASLWVHTKRANTNTPELRIDLPWLTILQQNSQFDLAPIFLCLCVTARSHVNRIVQARLKPPRHHSCRIRCRAIYGPSWPFHTIFSPWTLLCWQDNMETVKRPAANEGMESSGKEISQMDDGPESGVFLLLKMLLFAAIQNCKFLAWLAVV